MLFTHVYQDVKEYKFEKVPCAHVNENTTQIFTELKSKYCCFFTKRTTERNVLNTSSVMNTVNFVNSIFPHLLCITEA